MSTDHRARTEELLADYRSSRERLATVHQELDGISESARSGDRAVVVTVGSQGRLCELTIAEDAYQRYRPAELAATIVELATQAATGVTERAGDVLSPFLPTGTDPRAVLEGRADLDAECPRDRAVAARDDNGVGATELEDEEPLAEGGWLQDGTAKRSHP
ncbi:hypothetical protein FHX42_004286 [Saccharopolyspora lacisalsi]|uniref:YbaB/EbfC DNA-binding family protein n=1 Tax=Halosaccharopolyspora lacisalsi TaxID=1000566 RepID=A0A839E5A1_9PSEU|nr:YbaB/EbfC family nucleoid-associated protein [Halosaccharopolyspora lacisalsi]MBA8826907.1 hypothetical protein [Halosaccharopolyspora lacisalsi]